MDELIAQLEVAEGSDRKLDAQIERALGLQGTYLADHMGWDDMGHAIFRPGPHHYTSSVDAALRLIPKGASWMVSTEEPGPFAAVGESSCAYMAATPALALCVAALKAGGPNG